MPKVVKLSQLLQAVRVETPITLPLENGSVLTLARNGDFALFSEDQGFIKFVDAKKFAQDYTEI
jgi:hypothetical protein